MKSRLRHSLRAVRRRLRLGDLAAVWQAARLRARTRPYRAADDCAAPPHGLHPRVLFLLPVGPGGGGVHSVVQEVSGMRGLGAEARAAIPLSQREAYRRHYAELADDLFLPYGSLQEFVALAARFDVAVATIFSSMWLVGAAAAAHPRLAPAYYVQDYEPRFFPRLSVSRWLARRSYGLVPGTLHFAKTCWLCDVVRREHGVSVEKVAPSLDLGVYYPPEARERGDAVRISAMIRPASPQRGAARTMRVLRCIAQEAKRRTEVHVFGCSDEDLSSYRLETGFRFTNHGPLVREQVAALLRHCDAFVDFSDYQAFGRTALEAMACGCAVVVPAEGGAAEYAVADQNALVADSRHDEACHAALSRLVSGDALRRRLQAAAVVTSQRYSIEAAAASELALFRELRERWNTVTAQTLILAGGQ